MTFFADFCIPFIAGATVMFAVVVLKYATWFHRLPKSDKIAIAKGVFTTRSIAAAWEVFRESLLHRRIFRVNPLLGYMHMSLAFGWFLLIVVGWIETVAYLGFRWVPLQGHGRKCSASPPESKPLPKRNGIKLPSVQWFSHSRCFLRK